MRKQPNRPKRYKKPKKDWPEMIRSGKIIAFYGSPEWQDMRTAALMRDHYECQRCNGNFVTPNYPLEKITLTDATEVHHKQSIKAFPELCLNLDNIVSLCHECHDIVEERLILYLHTKRVKQVNDERWE